MGGRGRGRGAGARNAMSFNVEELGFRRGDALPVSQLAPPPLFPSVATRPAPFDETEELKYLQVLKEDFRTTMSKSPHFLKADEVKNSIERYSDRFKTADADAATSDEEDEKRLWHMPDKFFPAELNAAPKKRKKKKKKKAGKIGGGDPNDIASKLDELEKKEGDGEEEEEDEENAQPTAKKKKKSNKNASADGVNDDDEEDEEEEGEAGAGEGDDDEEEEEMGGNDYEQNYFDNGEDDANSSEDNLDEGGTY